jgi:hypothetical protein
MIVLLFKMDRAALVVGFALGMEAHATPVYLGVY